MIQDHRAVMQYSVSKESAGNDKILTDWYCAKVCSIIIQSSNPFEKRNKNEKKLAYFSVASSILNVVTTASNAVHRVKKAKKAEREVMKLATF